MKLIVVSLLVCGCSASKRIGGTASAIQDEAIALSDHGKSTGDMTVITGADRIYSLAQAIHSDLPAVEDKVPQWLVTLEWALIAVLAVAAIVILWQTGIGQAIRVAVGWIPRAKRQDAELAADMLDPKHKENAREYIAARRASDPEFNSAFKKAWVARKKDPKNAR